MKIEVKGKIHGYVKIGFLEEDALADYLTLLAENPNTDYMRGQIQQAVGSFERDNTVEFSGWIITRLRENQAHG